MLDEEDNSIHYCEKDCRLKIVVVGDGASGKTSLITKYAQDYYGKEYEQTIGLDFFNKRLSFEDGKSVLLQIWDIGGQTLGGNMLDKYVYKADVVLFVYDVTNRSSFDNIRDWITSVESMIQQEECDLVLIGNKVDLQHLRVVSKKEHERFAKDSRMGSHFISAKTGEAVSVMFKKVTAHKLKLRLSRSEIEATSTIVKANVAEQLEFSSPETSLYKPSLTKQKVVSKLCILL